MRVRPLRALQQRRGWAWSLAVPIIKPALLATTKPSWTGAEKIPSTGGCLVVLNHVSHVDPLTAAHVVYDHGRLPRYLAKSGLFRGRFMRFFMTAAGQIPVERQSHTAVGAYDAAVAAVRNGECVVVYPEGTITRDPAGWPMAAKSGAARIALATGCPVIPVGQWGAQALLPPYSAWVRPFPRKPIRMVVGNPVDLTDLLSLDPAPSVVAAATARIMDAITALVAEARGEGLPTAIRHDVRRTGEHPTGNPHRRAKKSRAREHR